MNIEEMDQFIEEMDEQIETEPNNPKRAKAYRRQMTRKKTNRRVQLTRYGHSPGVGCLNWGYRDGAYQQIGNHVQYPKSSRRQRFYKTYANRKLRRYHGSLPNGNGYRRFFDYAWEID